MAIFLTGSTGYIGAHIASNLLAEHNEPLNLLVRARDEQEGRERLWRSLQLHMDFPQFEDTLHSRIRIFLGDITSSHFGLRDEEYAQLVRSTDSVIHCAASLNRKSEKMLPQRESARHARSGSVGACGRAISMACGGSATSARLPSPDTVQDEVVEEDTAIDWNRSDYDPYARTKKFCEHMVRQLLPDVPTTIFRPSIVLGDSRRPETNQFDMVRAFVFLAGLPALPFRPDGQNRHRPGRLRGGSRRDAAPEREVCVRDLPPFFGRRIGNVRPVDRCARCRAGETRPRVRAEP